MNALVSRLRRRPEAGILLIALVVMVVLHLLMPDATVSLQQVLVRASTAGLIAMGLTVVIVQGHFDLSVGTTYALGAIFTIFAGTSNPGLAILAAAAVGLVLGLINGFIVGVMGINSLIATIATGSIGLGLAYLITDEAPVQGNNVAGAIAFLKPVWWLITPPVIIFLIALIILQLFMLRTRTGRDFYAIGGYRDAARAAGIPVRWRVFQGFIISGLCAAIGGWLTAIKLDAANPNQSIGVALLAVAAVVIGGTALTGGTGSPLGTALAALLLAWIGSTFDAEGMSAMVRDITYGSILLLVVAADQFADVVRAIRRQVGRRIRLISSRRGAATG